MSGPNVMTNLYKEKLYELGRRQPYYLYKEYPARPIDFSSFEEKEVAAKPDAEIIWQRVEQKLVPLFQNHAKNIVVRAEVDGKMMELKLDENGEGEWAESAKAVRIHELHLPSQETLDQYVQNLKFKNIVYSPVQERVQLQDKHEKIKIGDGVYFDVDGYTAKPFGQRMGTFVSLADENGYAFVQYAFVQSTAGPVGAAVVHDRPELLCDLGSNGLHVDLQIPSSQGECRCDIFNFGCTCGQMDRERASH